MQWLEDTDVLEMIVGNSAIHVGNHQDPTFQTELSHLQAPHFLPSKEHLGVRILGVISCLQLYLVVRMTKKLHFYALDTNVFHLDPFVAFLMLDFMLQPYAKSCR